ncbi:MAG: hypothetical protein K8T89_20855, partial [Planctomycetes bacterium]|nr:hypothetical protein [Planctomycetota bacterium]
MRIRHKPPTLVSMWMLDVFCCALGCVILLLLLKMRETSLIAEESEQASSELVDTKLTLTDCQETNFALSEDLSDRNRQLALVQQERDELAKNLALVRDERVAKGKILATAENAIKTLSADLALNKQKLEDNAKLLAMTREKSAVTDDQLARRKDEVAELTRKVTEARKTEESLERLLREKEKVRVDTMKQAADLTDRLAAIEAKLRASDIKVDDLKTKAADAVKLRTRVQDLEKVIADANVAIVDLQGTKAKLADKINKLEIESEQRFAGIAMTGKP